jgi:hypothetical protein
LGWILIASGVVQGEGAPLAIDSSENVYVVASFPSSAGQFLLKATTDGAVTWQRKLGTASMGGKGVCVDSSGNVYTVGLSNTVVKYNSSGTLQWQETYGGPGGGGPYAIATDGTYLTASGPFNSSSPTSASAINASNGTAAGAWSSNSPGTFLDSMLGVDASYGRLWCSSKGKGNIGITSTSNLNQFLQIQSIYPSQNFVYRSVKGYASNGYYAAGYRNTGSFNAGWLMKATTNSPPGCDPKNAEWIRQITSGSTNLEIQSVALDPSGNVYVTFFPLTFDGYRTIQIVKFNSSGTVQWQRGLRKATTDLVSYGVAASNTSVYFSITTSTEAGAVKFPSDGTSTGTYGGYTWYDSSANYTITTISVSSYNIDQYGNTGSSFTVTIGSSTLTASTPTQTTTLTTV